MISPPCSGFLVSDFDISSFDLGSLSALFFRRGGQSASGHFENSLVYRVKVNSGHYLVRFGGPNSLLSTTVESLTIVDSRGAELSSVRARPRSLTPSNIGRKENATGLRASFRKYFEDVPRVELLLILIIMLKRNDICSQARVHTSMCDLLGQFCEGSTPYIRTRRIRTS